MKKSKLLLLVLVTMLVFLVRSDSAFAALSKEGYIRDMPDVVYKHFIVSKDGLIVTLVNKSDKEIKFEAGISFLNERNREVATAFIPATILPPHGTVPLRNITIITDYQAAKRAVSIAWHIY